MQMGDQAVALRDLTKRMPRIRGSNSCTVIGGPQSVHIEIIPRGVKTPGNITGDICI